MRTREELSQFFEHELSRALTILEYDRRSVLRTIVVGTIIAVVVLAMVGGAAEYYGTPWYFIVFPAAPVLGAFVGVPTFNKHVDYQASFKRSVIEPFIRWFDERLSYDEKKWVSWSEFVDSNIFEKPDKYHGQDYVSGRLGQTFMEFSDIWAHKEHESTSDDGKTKKYETLIFTGVFFSAEFNKAFRGRLVVLTDKHQKLLGRFGETFQWNDTAKGELVRLENPDFEREFLVYGTDQVEARYILTPSLMERILALKQRTGVDIQLAFAKTRIYIAIPYSRSLFEPQIFRSGNQLETFEQYFNDLAQLTSIVEELDLNTRIWTKQ